MTADQGAFLDMTPEAGSDRGWVTVKVLRRYQARFPVTELYTY